MDFSMPPLGPAAAPRAVPDLRPTADAAATTRVDKPPAALAQGAAVPSPPVSVTQAALVSRNLFDPRSHPTSVSADAVDGPPRVLEPFGVSMLPSDEREVPERAGADEEGEGEAKTPTASEAS